VIEVTLAQLNAHARTVLVVRGGSLRSPRTGATRMRVYGPFRRAQLAQATKTLTHAFPGSVVSRFNLQDLPEES
jgi:hypothetical protein